MSERSDHEDEMREIADSAKKKTLTYVCGGILIASFSDF